MMNRMVGDETKHLETDGRFGPLTHHASNCLISRLDEMLQLKEMEKQAQISELAELQTDEEMKANSNVTSLWFLGTCAAVALLFLAWTFLG